MTYRSTKRIGPISTGHRQWKDKGHCSFIHGYGRIVEFTFACDDLDEKGWVVDFGGLRAVKQWLEDEWDHKVLIASSDPKLDLILQMDKAGLINVNIIEEPYNPGIELSCRYVFDNIDPYIREITKGRCWIESVRIWEHENNSAIYTKDDA